MMWITKVTVLLVTCVLHVKGQYNYAEALEKSIQFYEAQRSGPLPADNRIDWRGDSALGDGSDVGLDLTGGWYDAGDHVKFGYPMAWSVTTLAWSIVDFRAGYESTGQLGFALDGIKWATDYFIKCRQGDTFYGQVGNGDTDHGYWGRPEEMTMERPAYSVSSSAPGSDLLGETAAAMAASSMAFQATDPGYADTLRSEAIALYDHAYNNRGIYSQSMPQASPFYVSSGFNDELAWGAVWLYRLTGDQLYMDRALEFYSSGLPWAYSWDSKDAGVQLMMYILTGEQQYADHTTNFIRSYMPGGQVTTTPGGLAWRDAWGCLRYAGNAAFIAILAESQGVMVGEARTWGKSQVDYILGSNPQRSYVVGFGTNPPERCHHRGASCEDLPATCDWPDKDKPGPNGQILFGAVVGGPDANDQFTDDRNDFQSNEVTTDYNAGFQGAVAGLLMP